MIVIVPGANSRVTPEDVIKAVMSTRGDQEPGHSWEFLIDDLLEGMPQGQEGQAVKES